MALTDSLRVTGRYASMRPRRCRRGELPRRSCRHPTGIGLQCGHGGVAVENPRTATGPIGRAGTFNAATAVSPWRTRHVANARRPGDRFNAATAVSPWRTEAAIRCVTAFHGFNAATAVSPWRTWDRLKRRGWAGTGFNAATAGSPGRNGRAPEGTTSGMSFNAATGVSPWRTPKAIAYRIPEGELQCGHGGVAVENFGDLVYECRGCVLLQCGHGGVAVENFPTREAGEQWAEASMQP